MTRDAPKREIGPDDPLTLKEAAEIVLRGVVKAATLRAAASRGELTVERLGRSIVTTRRYIEEWRARSKVVARQQPAHALPDEITPARAAAQRTIDRLRKGLT
jgi:hypothetical protein